MQFDISSAKLEKLVIHRVGNKSRDEGFHLSQVEADISQEVESILLRNYLGATLKENNVFGFWHESDLKFNEVYAFSNAMLMGESKFLETSVSIAKHLYGSSLHPNIAAGDLFVVLFTNISIDGNISSALGIFKTEAKEAYFSVEELESVLNISKRDGINPSKLQKAALIIDGYNTVLVADKFNSNSRYWVDTFLKARPVSSSSRAALLATNVFKKTLSSIDDLEACAAYKEEFFRVAKQDAPASVGDLVAISQKYIGPEATDIATKNAALALDIDYLPDAEIEKNRLERSIRLYARKVRIATGLDLVISNGVEVKSVKRQPSSDSQHLTIDIQLGGK